MKKNIIIFSLGLIWIILFGVFYNNAIVNEQEEAKSIIHMVTSLGVDRLEEDSEVTLLEENNVTILHKYDGYADDDIVAYIYIGETAGFKEGLQVAFAIDATTHHIVGMRIVESNETADYLRLLNQSEEFLLQFTEKDMSAVKFEIELISGATPNGTENDVIGKFTCAGMENIMKVVRKQYDQDTAFVAPTELALISKTQNMDDLNEFQYEFAVGEQTVSVTTDKTYTITSISDPTQQTQIETFLAKASNKLNAYIDAVETVGTTVTLTVHSKGYGTTRLVSTVVITDGDITSFSTDLSTQSYDDDHNELYTGGSFNPVFQAIVDNTDLVSVTGATITFTGIVHAHQITNLYIAEVLQ